MGVLGLLRCIIAIFYVEFPVFSHKTLVFHIKIRQNHPKTPQKRHFSPQNLHFLIKNTSKTPFSYQKHLKNTIFLTSKHHFLIKNTHFLSKHLKNTISPSKNTIFLSKTPQKHLKNTSKTPKIDSKTPISYVISQVLGLSKEDSRLSQLRKNPAYKTEMCVYRTAQVRFGGFFRVFDRKIGVFEPENGVFEVF
jgi:hypothetical protein